MVRFLSDEKIEEEETTECNAMFGCKINDEWINITVVVKASPELDGDEFHDFVETEGKKILASILTPEAMKMKWGLEDID